MCDLSEENNWSVYVHVNKENGKRYVGITGRDPRMRWGSNGGQYTEKKHLCFNNAIKKYGWDGFDHIVLFTGLTKTDAQKKEAELIKEFHSCVFDKECHGYNMTFGGSGTKGYKLSDDVKARMSETRKGENNSFYGHHHTEELKQKWRDERTGTNTGVDNPFFGKKHSDETRKILSEHAKKRVGDLNPNYGNHKLAGENHPWYGKHLPEETKRKISESRKGKYGGKNCPTAKSVKCIETGKVYDTIKEAADDLGLDNSEVGKCCKNPNKATKGCHFVYAKEINNAGLHS